MEADPRTLRTIEQITKYVLTRGRKRKRGSMSEATGEEKLQWAQEVLTAVRYESLSREGKGIVRTHLQQQTGYSRSHVERIIREYRGAVQGNPDAVAAQPASPSALSWRLWSAGAVALLLVVVSLTRFAAHPQAELTSVSETEQSDVALRIVSSVPPVPRPPLIARQAPAVRHQAYITMRTTARGVEAHPLLVAQEEVVVTETGEQVVDRIAAHSLETLLTNVAQRRDERQARNVLHAAATTAPISPPDILPSVESLRVTARNLVSFLGQGDDGQVLTIVNGRPQWQNLPPPPRPGLGRRPHGGAGHGSAPGEGGRHRGGGGGGGSSGGGSTGSSGGGSSGGGSTTDNTKWTRTDPVVYLTNTTDSVGIGTTTPATKLEVVGSISGTTLNLSGLAGCDSIDTDADGNLICGTDNATGSGLSVSVGDTRYVNVAGDTMTGALTINLDSGTLGLNVLQTISGATIHAQQSLTSSGTFAVAGATTLQSSLTTSGKATFQETLTAASGATFDTNTLVVDALNNRVGVLQTSPETALDVAGTISGSSLTISALKNCDSIDTDADGNLSCGTDSFSNFSTGNVITIAEARYVDVAGDTMTGQLVIDLESGDVALNARQTISGSIIQASSRLISSGSLTITGDASVGGTLTGSTLHASASFFGASLTNCTGANKLQWSDGTFSCAADLDTTSNFGTGNVIAIADGLYVNVAGDTMTGALTINLDSGTLGLNVLQTISGATIHAAQYLTSSGAFTVEGTTLLSGGTLTVTDKATFQSTLTASSGATFDTNTLVVDALNNRVGILQTSPETALDVNGTISGSSLTISSLESCDTIDTDADGNFVCGTDGGGAAFGTGNTIDVSEVRYVNVAGDTMTGMLVIDLESGNIALNARQTISGSVLQASSRLISSGSLTIAGDATVGGILTGSTLVASTSFYGASLTDCTGSNKLQWSNGTFSCTADLDTTSNFGSGNVTDIADGLYVNQAGDTMTGTLTIDLDSGTVGLNVREIISGATIHAQQNLTASGTGIFAGSLTTRGALSGDTLTISSLQGCDTIDTDADGNFVCGTDNTAASGLDVGTADERYVNIAGDTMTGGLTINLDSGTLGLNVLQTISGATIHAQQSLTSSGTGLFTGNLTTRGVLSGDSLSIQGTAAVTGKTTLSDTLTASSGATFDTNTLVIDALNNRVGILQTSPETALDVNGTISGSSLTISSLESCDTIDTDADGNFVCGTDGGGAAFGTGNTIDVSEVRYVNVAGDTMTGTLVVNLTSGDIAINAKQTISGSIIQASNRLISSGSLTIAGDADIGGTLTGSTLHASASFFGASLTNCTGANKLQWSDGTFSCTADIDTTSNFGSGNVTDIADGLYVNQAGDTMTGTLTIDLDSGTVGLNVREIISGATIHAQQSLTSSGTGLFAGNLTTRGTLSGDILSVQNTATITGKTTLQDTLTAASGATFDTNTLVIDALNNRVGILQTSPETALDVNGTISGSSLTISSLESCDTIDTDADGNFVCGTDGGGTAFGTGNTIDVSEVRYVNVAGDTMTGTLVVNLESGDIAINAKQTISGSIIQASSRLISSGSLTITGDADIGGTLTGATIHASTSFFGASLTNCTGANKLQWSDGTFSCTTDLDTTSNFGTGNVIDISEVRYVNVAGDTMTGALTINLDSGTLGLNVLQTISGATIHAAQFLTASGTLTVEGATLLSGGTLTVTDKATFQSTLTAASGATFDTNTLVVDALNNRVGILEVSPETALDVKGAISGSSLTISGLENCNTIDTDADGNFVCGVDATAGSGLDVGTADERYVNIAGDTMTGGLTINLDSGTLGLNVLQIISGATIHAQQNLTASGTGIFAGNLTTRGVLSGDSLSIQGTAAVTGKTTLSDTLTASSGATFDTNTLVVDALNNRVGILQTSPETALDVNGTISGSSLTISSLESCDTIDTDADGNFVCGTDGGSSDFGTGNTIDVSEVRYVNVAGDTMTGTLVVNLTSGDIAINAKQTISGSIIQASSRLISSGSLTIAGDADIGGTLTGATIHASTSFFGASLTNCTGDNKLQWSNGTFSCVAESGASNFSTGNVLSITEDLYVNTAGDTMTGGLTINLDSGTLGLNVLQTISGATIHAQQYLTASGTLVAEDEAFLNSGAILAGNLIPSVTNAYDLGTNTNRWRDLYLSGGTINLGDAATNITVRTGSGNPNGVLAGSTGSIYMDNFYGDVYAKTGGDGGNQGWTILSTGSGTSYPTRATLWHDESTVLVGDTTITRHVATVEGVQPYNYVAHQNTGADGDTFTNGFFLAAGTYTFSVLGQTYSDRGIIDWFIDGVQVVDDQDWYSGSAVNNVVQTATVTVTGDGYHVLKGVIDGNNASSSDHIMALTKMWFTPAADESNIGQGSTTVTLQNAYTNDPNGGSAVITLTSDDDSIQILNPAAGGTDSGAVLYVTNLDPTKIALNVSGLLSGSTLHAQQSLTSSGTGLFAGNLTTRGTLSGDILSVQNTATITGKTTLQDTLTAASGATFDTNTLVVDALNNRVGILQTSPETALDVNGTISGSSLTISSLESCDTIDTDADGNFVCGTDGGGAAFGTGNTIDVSEVRYVNVAGDTMTGTLVVNLTSGDIAINAKQTISGSIIQASSRLISSGSLTITGDADIGGTLTGATIHASTSFFGASLTNCTGANKLLWSDGTFSCAAESGGGSSNFSTGNVLDIAENLYVNTAGDTMTGALTINLDSGTLGLNVLQTISGATIHAQQSLTSSGTGLFAGNLTTRGVLSGDSLSIQGTAAVTGKTTLSNTLTASSGATFDTNTLVVDAANNRVGILQTSPETALDVNGTISGSSLTISSLENCDTIDTDADGNFTCGTDNTAASGLDVGTADERYVNVAGDTMTGALFIDAESDAIQLRVQADGAQAANTVVVENSLGTDWFVIESDGDVNITTLLAVGDLTGQAYNLISNVSTAGNASDDNDLYIEDILEVDGITYLDNDLFVANNFSVGGIADQGYNAISASATASDADISSVNDLYIEGSLEVDDTVIFDENLILSGTVAIGGVGEQSYNTISNIATASYTSATQITGNNDLFIEGALEVDGAVFFDTGALITNSSDSTALLSLADATDRVELYVGSASPESSFSAQIGSLFMDYFNGALYLKTSNDGGNTGWSQLQTAGAGLTQSDADGLYVNVAGDTMTGALFIDADTDAIQLQVQANDSQASNTVVFEDSLGTDWFVIESDGDVNITTLLAVGDVTGQAYNLISNVGTAGNASDDNDFYIEDILEVDGITYLDNDLLVANNFSVGGIADQGYNAISDSGTANNASTDDDLYIEDILEVDGNSYFASLATFENSADTALISLSDTSTLDTVEFYTGNANPENSVSANIGSLYFDHSAGVVYIKESNDGGSTGWAAVATGGGGSFGTGNVLAITEDLYVNTAGDTMTGGLTINLDSGTLGLNVLQTISGATIHAQQYLTASGTLSVENEAFLNSGAILSGNLIPMVTNRFDLGTNTNRWRDLYLSGGTIHIGESGNEATIEYQSDLEYLGFNADGTGTPEVVILTGGNVGIGTVAPETELEIIGTASGLIIHAEDFLTSSGQVIVEPKLTYESGSIFLNQLLNGTGMLVDSEATSNPGIAVSMAGNQDAYPNPHVLFGYKNMFDLKLYRAGTGMLATDATYVVPAFTDRQSLGMPERDGLAQRRWEQLFLTGTGVDLGTESSSGSIRYNGSGDYLGFDPDNDDVDEVIITSGGKVGIGTVSPDADLEVEGVISGTTLSVQRVASHLIPASDATYDLGSGGLRWRDLYLSGGTIYLGENNNEASIGYNSDLEYLNINANGSGSSEMVITTGGLIGVGTGTSLTAKLSIYADDAHNAEGILIRTDESTNTQNVFRVVSDVAGANDPAFRIQADGAVHSDNAYTSMGADYAEWFATQDADLTSGELVCIDVTEPNTVERCTDAADSNVMGIVSTNPAFVGNKITGAGGLMPPGYVLVGLIGQVPTKVMNENGPIRPGDSLTPASVPGFARRALPGEPTVGVALESSEGREGVVNVLISRRNSSVTVETVEEHVLQTVAAMEIEDEVQLLVSDAVDNLDVSAEISLAVAEQLKGIDLRAEITQILAEESVTPYQAGRWTDALTFSGAVTLEEQLMALGGVSVAGGLHVGGELAAKTITVSGGTTIGAGLQVGESLHVTKDTRVAGTLSAALLDVADATVRGSLAVDGTLIINGQPFDPASFTVDPASIQELEDLVVKDALHVVGDITIDGLARFLGDVHVEGHLHLSKRQAGQAVLERGDSRLIITFEPELPADPIVTASSDSFTPWRVMHRSLTGFTIATKEPAEEDITFDWMAVAQLAEGQADAPTVVSEGDQTEDVLLAFLVDQRGVPLSSDAVFNGYIRGHVPLNSEGTPYRNSHYQGNDKWTHPDFPGLEFFYSAERGLDVEDLRAKGYEVEVVIEDAEESEESEDAEESEDSEDAGDDSEQAFPAVSEAEPPSEEQTMDEEESDSAEETESTEEGESEAEEAKQDTTEESQTEAQEQTGEEQPVTQEELEVPAEDQPQIEEESPEAEAEEEPAPAETDPTPAAAAQDTEEPAETEATEASSARDATEPESPSESAETESDEAAEASES